MIGKTELEALARSSARGGRIIRGFSMAGFLSKDELESLFAGAVRTKVISGGPAGDHAVSGIAIGDALRSVLKLDVSQGDHPAQAHSGAAVSPHAAVALEGADLAATQADHATAARHPDHTVTQPDNHPALAHARTWSVADLTGEFAVTGANKINNAGGSDTTGAILVVVFEDLTP